MGSTIHNSSKYQDQNPQIKPFYFPFLFFGCFRISILGDAVPKRASKNSTIFKLQPVIYYLFLTKFVFSIVMNKPYDSTRLICPITMSPTCRLLKLLISDWEAVLESDVFKVTSMRFDKGSTDNTLQLNFSIQSTEYQRLITSLTIRKLPASYKFPNRKLFFWTFHISI